MSEPKHPDKKAPLVLNDKIDELEDLLESKATSNTPAEEKLSSQKPALDIPILDDIVDYNQESVLRNVLPKADKPPQVMKTSELTQQAIPQQELSSVLDQVEDKITNELDSLVDILKDAIKDSVMSEIKSQLKRGQEKPVNETANKPKPENK